MKDVHHYPYQSLQICSLDQQGRSKINFNHIFIPIYLDLAEAKSFTRLVL